MCLLQDKHEPAFQHDKYDFTLKLEKAPDSVWSDITQRSYGNKKLRFTHRNNGQIGVWFVVRFPIKTIFESVDDRVYHVRVC